MFNLGLSGWGIVGVVVLLVAGTMAPAKAQKIVFMVAGALALVLVGVILFGGAAQSVAGLK